MPLDRSPLEPTQLTDAARKVLLGPPAARMMAARGLSPLKPGELAVVLYHMVIGEDQAQRGIAEKSIADLAEKTFAAALADPALDPRVIDYFAGPVAARPALVEVLLLNRATSDLTVLDLVHKLGEKELELVAVNEARLLRTPAIIGALYMNPKARMSTVDRLVELAIRNHVENPGIPRWDDVVEAVTGQAVPKGELQEVADVDGIFATVAAVAIGADPSEFVTLAPDIEGDDLEIVNRTEEQKLEEEKKEIPIDKLSISGKIRLATLGNAFARAVLIRDPIKMVSLAAINSPGMTENEVIKHSANRALADDVIRVIANTKEWTRLYSIKVNLVNNPKCPLPVSMRMLPHLHARELKNLSRSKGVPSALTAMAKKLMQARNPNG